MDFLDLIITIAILCVGGLLTGKKGKKTDPRQSAKQNRPVFEVPAADFSDEETEIGDFFTDDDYDAATEKSEEKAPSYFTYEDLYQSSGNTTTAEAVKPVKPSVSIGEEDTTERVFPVLGEAFDLRKAFIYQTILERVEC